MARRSTINPAKVKADLSALEEAPPPEVYERRLALRRRLSVALLCLLTMVLMSVCFVPYGQWYLAYVALVPWLAALDGATHRRWSLLCAWLAGLLFWAANLYWLWWITLVGYAALVVYCSLYWLVAGWVLQGAMRRNWPLWIVLPVVWVGLEYARAHIISGFPWFFLAHSQFAQTPLIQVSDLTGQYGVSFFVCMVNGAIVDLFDSPLFVASGGGPRLARRTWFGVVASLAALGAMLGYGWWRMSQETTRPGPVVALVQHSYPIRLDDDSFSSYAAFRNHLDSTRRIAEDFEARNARCGLVVWPETMLMRGMNPAMLDVNLSNMNVAELRAMAAQVSLYPEGAARASESTLRQYLVGKLQTGSDEDGRPVPGLRTLTGELGAFSRRLQCPILAGGATLHPNPLPTGIDDRWVTRNSALWFEMGDRASVVYSKMHLVPFSEYVPFKRSWPAFHHLLRWFVPPVMEQLDPGPEPVAFTLKTPEGTFVLAAPICYEGTFPHVCRELIAPEGRKRADILVNLSNDGWFVWAWGQPRGSTEHSQHLIQYCFRAVENRVPVVRAVNTGISASIDSNGRILSEIEYGENTMIAGNLILDGACDDTGKLLPEHGPKVLVDQRVSVYSRTGDWFAMAVTGAAALLAGWMLLRRRPATGNEKKGTAQ